MAIIAIPAFIRMRKKVVLTTIALCGLLLAFMSHRPTNETMTTKRRDVITSTLISISNTVFEDGQLELADVRSRGVRVCSQRERLTHLHDACARHRNRMSVALLAPANRSVVDDIHGMLYCFLSKVGCTAMKIAIAKANAHHMGPHSYKHLPEPGKPMMVHHTKKMSRLGLNLMSEFNEEESRRRVDRYFKFMILRHPLDRLVSVWRDKLVHINQSELVYRKWPAEILRKYRPKEFARVFGDRSTVRYQALYDHFGVPRFDEFLTWVAELGLRNDHWLSAVDACHVCAHPWDVNPCFGNASIWNPQWMTYVSWIPRALPKQRRLSSGVPALDFGQEGRQSKRLSDSADFRPHRKGTARQE